MRNNIRQKISRPFIGVALALIVLCGCDDSHNAKQPAKVVTHKPYQTLATPSGAGWRATTEITVSQWGFDRRADNGAPDSLAAIRTALDANMLPPRDSVRIADLVDRLLPAMDIAEPGAFPTPSFSPSVTLVTTPWNVDTLLLWVDISVLRTSEAASISIAFNPDIISAFRPLGDPDRLPILTEARSGAAMLYELMPRQGVTAQNGTALAVLRVAEGPSGKSEPGKSEPRKSEPDKKEWTISATSMKDNFDDAPQIVRFAAAVAGFGGLLRGDPAVRDLSCSDVIALAQSADKPDPDGRRAEIIRLMQRAEPLMELPPSDAPPTQDLGR
jgi:hypothetical protein